MRLNIALLILALTVAVGCKASFPAAPSATTGIVAMQVLLQNTVSWPGNVGDRAVLQAIALDVHGEYRNVTAQAVWTSSDPSIVQLSFGNMLLLRDGLADVTATYEGFRSSLIVAVSPPPRLPYLAILSTSSRKFVGNTETLRAVVWTASSTFTDVTPAATFRSSDPRVATVDGARVTAREPGNVEITASYDGMSAALRFSVYPLRCC